MKIWFFSDFAKKILPIQEYNELKTTYDLAKINAEDVKLIRTLSLDEADKLIDSLAPATVEKMIRVGVDSGIINKW